MYPKTNSARRTGSPEGLHTGPQTWGTLEKSGACTLHSQLPFGEIIHVHWKRAWRRWIVLIDIDMACVWNVRCPFRCWDVVKAAFWLACLVLHALSVDATVQDISGFQKSSDFAVKCMNYRCFHSVSFNCLWWYVIAHFSCQAFCCSIKSLSQDVRHSSTEPFKHWMTLGDDLAHILIP